MKLMNLNETNATVLIDEDRYPDGANFPTRHIEYLCPCRKGKIVHESVSGFDDYWTEIECKTCARKYEIRSGWGYIWELVEKS